MLSIRFFLFAILLGCLSFFPSQSFGANIGTAVWMNDYPEAKCLDGTPALYYIRHSTSRANSTKWVFHFQGGGWCDDMSACKLRANSRLGSSAKKWNNNETMDLNNIDGCNNNRWCGALMVNDQKMNPYSFDWNAVLLMYCDGASWIGNMEQPVEGLYFRGWQSLQAIMTDLLANHGLNQATEVLIGGDSAGGLATFYHIDYMSERIKSANSEAMVLGMPDSGFWPDAEGFAKTFRNMHQMQNGSAGLQSDCFHKYPTNITMCLFPQYFAPLIKSPLWPIQSIFDPLQKGKQPEKHGLWLLDQLQKTVLANPQNGGWIHSCERHCGAELLHIDGVQVPEAIQMFLHTPDPIKKAWIQNETYPCTSCCNDNYDYTIKKK